MSGKENETGRHDLPQLLQPREVAQLLGISVKTVHKLVRDGKLGCVQVTARDRRFTQEQVRCYIESCTTNAPAKIDRDRSVRVRSQPPKGGEKSSRVFDRANLLKEIRSWQ
jgi:excisionase family DNA binding protein